MAKSNLVHLHVHSQYSLLDGSIKLKQLLARVSDMDQGAVALTDHGAMHGVVELFKLAKDFGVNPIVGCELYMGDATQVRRNGVLNPDWEIDHLVVLVENETGYRNLSRLLSRAWIENSYRKPLVKPQWLFEGSEGLICLSGCATSELFKTFSPRLESQLKSQEAKIEHWNEVSPELQAARREAARELAGRYQKVFGDRYYIELQPNVYHARLNRELVELARDLNLPVVATGDAHYLGQGDADAHETLLCIHQKTKVGGKLNADESKIEWDRGPNGHWSFGRDESRTGAPGELFIMTEDEMRQALEVRLDKDCVGKAIEHTSEIAERVKFGFKLGTPRLPVFATSRALQAAYLKKYLVEKKSPAQAETMRLEEVAKKELEKFFNRRETLTGRKFTDREQEIYGQRLEYELGVIKDLGFSGYMLIVADFINWARTEKIEVGPGRGSAAGSLVAMLLEITKVDPIRWDLLFERFLNSGRKALPDIDVDFGVEGRDRVVDYVRDAYRIVGKNGLDALTTAQIVTFGTMKGKMAIRDVGRVLGMSPEATDAITGLYPDPLHGKEYSLEEAVDSTKTNQEVSHYLAAALERKPLLNRLARAVEGLSRHSSRHAAGLVIAPEPLADLVPLCVVGAGAFAPNSDTTDGTVDSGRLLHAVSQYDMRVLEDLGLVKFDFLGLRNLSIIARARKILQDGGVSITADFDDPPLGPEDLPPGESPDRIEQVFEMLREGGTSGVFQLESGGMTRFVKELKPARFADLIAILALYRPGPLGTQLDFPRPDAPGEIVKLTMAELYARRKNEPDKWPVEYVYQGQDLRDRLEPVLGDTYGIIIYQEQVMRIAQVLAGYSLEEADNLRRAMGKKKADEMARSRESFLAGCQDRGMTRAATEKIWEQMETFAAYGFNKSHAAAYALTTWRTAWLRRHYTVEFFAAMLSVDAGTSRDDQSGQVTARSADKLAAGIRSARQAGIEVLPPDVESSASGFSVVKVPAEKSGLEEPGRKVILCGLSMVRNVTDAAAETIISARKLQQRRGFDDLRHFLMLCCIGSENNDHCLNVRQVENLVKSGAMDGVLRRTRHQLSNQQVEQPPDPVLGVTRRTLLDPVGYEKPEQTELARILGVIRNQLTKSRKCDPIIQIPPVNRQIELFSSNSYQSSPALEQKTKAKFDAKFELERARLEAPYPAIRLSEYPRFVLDHDRREMLGCDLDEAFLSDTAVALVAPASATRKFLEGVRAARERIQREPRASAVPLVPDDKNTDYLKLIGQIQHSWFQPIDSRPPLDKAESKTQRKERLGRLRGVRFSVRGQFGSVILSWDKPRWGKSDGMDPDRIRQGAAVVAYCELRHSTNTGNLRLQVVQNTDLENPGLAFNGRAYLDRSGIGFLVPSEASREEIDKALVLAHETVPVATNHLGENDCLTVRIEIHDSTRGLIHEGFYPASRFVEFYRNFTGSLWRHKIEVKLHNREHQTAQQNSRGTDPNDSGESWEELQLFQDRPANLFALLTPIEPIAAPVVKSPSPAPAPVRPSGAMVVFPDWISF